jgi:hypothetical protein
MKHFLLAILALTLVGCVEEKKSDLAVEETTVVDGKYHPVKALEVIPGGGYVYVKALENNDTIWMAMSPAKITVGETYYYTEVMEMTNFASKELDRTFDKIYFLDRLLNDAREPLPGETHTQSALGQNSNIQFEAEEGIITIADLYKNRTDLAGQKVTVRGQVTKVNNDIMDRNWVHIQDGTSDGQDFDLTITTKAKVELGAIVKFSGTVSVDKDFTLGYKYKLLVEDAVLPDVQM